MLSIYENPDLLVVEVFEPELFISKSPYFYLGGDLKPSMVIETQAF